MLYLSLEVKVCLIIIAEGRCQSDEIMEGKVLNEHTSHSLCGEKLCQNFYNWTAVHCDLCSHTALEPTNPRLMRMRLLCY